MAGVDDNGFVTIHRKIMQWEWYTDANTYRVFTHLLYLANHKETRWRGEVIRRGQVLTGRHQLSRELRISERGIRTALEHLKTTNEVTIKTTNQFSVITINNYCEYQDKKDRKRPAERPAERQTTDQQPTTSNNDNNDNKKNMKSRGTASVPNPGFSDHFMTEVWPYFARHKKVPYTSIERQGVAIRLLHEKCGGNEETAKQALRETLSNNYQGFTWYFDRKGGTNGTGGKINRNGTLADQRPLAPEDLPGLMQRIADDPRYA